MYLLSLVENKLFALLIRFFGLVKEGHRFKNVTYLIQLFYCTAWGGVVGVRGLSFVPDMPCPTETPELQNIALFNRAVGHAPRKQDMSFSDTDEKVFIICSGIYRRHVLLLALELLWVGGTGCRQTRVSVRR